MQKLKKYKIYKLKIKKYKNKLTIIKLKLIICKKNFKNQKNKINLKNKEVMKLYLLKLNYKIKFQN